MCIPFEESLGEDSQFTQSMRILTRFHQLFILVAGGVVFTIHIGGYTLIGLSFERPYMIPTFESKLRFLPKTTVFEWKRQFLPKTTLKTMVFDNHTENHGFWKPHWKPWFSSKTAVFNWKLWFSAKTTFLSELSRRQHENRSFEKPGVFGKLQFLVKLRILVENERPLS